jgi:DNA-binding NarL/FixJ family response regulator
MCYNILLADPHPVVRTGIKTLLSHQPFRFFEADNGLDAINTISANRIHVAIVDVKMPKVDGLEVTDYVLREHPNIKLVLFSSNS